MSRILVGYDGSDSGREARESHGHITVLSVVEMPLNPDVPRVFGTLDDISANEGQPFAPPPDAVAHLTEARDLLAASGVDVDLAWTAGEPGAEIVDFAKRIRATAIVVGEHHHGFLSHMFGGDVDEAVQREAGCTVILA